MSLPSSLAQAGPLAVAVREAELFRPAPPAVRVPRAVLPRTGTDRAVRSTRLLFAGLCFYIASQSYMIPLQAVGPSWTLWPRLTDLAVGLLFLAALPAFLNGAPLPAANRKVLKGLLLISVCWFASYLLLTVFIPTATGAFGRTGRLWGAYGLLRVAQFIVGFVCVSYVPLTPGRLKMLRLVSLVTLVLVCLGVLATYYDLIPTTTFAAHLPSDPTVAGAWFKYFDHRSGDGLGTIGYNHAYPAAQIVLLFAFRWHVSGSKTPIVNMLLLLLSLFAVSVTGSRSGLGAMVVLTGLYGLRAGTSGYLTLALFLSLAALVGGVFGMFGKLPIKSSHVDRFQETRIFRRQKTTFQFYQAENLSSRDRIWNARVSFLSKNPQYLMTGTGYGSTIDLGLPGTSAHSLFLHVLVEMGLWGFCLFTGMLVALLRLLWRLDSHRKAIFWVTIVLLLTSGSQETLYTETYMGHFLGFYLCCVAVALRSRADGKRYPTTEKSKIRRLGRLDSAAKEYATVARVRPSGLEDEC